MDEEWAVGRATRAAQEITGLAIDRGKIGVPLPGGYIVATIPEDDDYDDTCLFRYGDAPRFPQAQPEYAPGIHLYYRLSWSAPRELPYPPGAAEDLLTWEPQIRAHLAT